MSILRKIRDALAPRRRSDPPIELHDSGFSVDGRDVAWGRVIEIRAYKLDLYTYDEIRFSFLLDSGCSMEISEEQPGFTAFVAAMTARFPSTSDWHSRVSQPAFARNETVLFPFV